MKTLVYIVMLVLSSSAMAGIEDCIKTVRAEWPYPSVAEASKICAGNVSESCIKYIRAEWPYPSMAEAAKMCKTNMCE